jgi:competence protein ComEA
MKTFKVLLAFALAVFIFSSYGLAQEVKKININTATVEELATLPGIGDSTAKNIVEHRNNNGNFQTVEDLMNVTGIGEKKFEKIKDMITVGQADSSTASN